ncbi:rho GDP-dissociation inhibitor 1-like [Tripterygium wilfordii]|uniref:Rho GDP-dissociation inhibitor 1-like n=2 Tax=Tripterygium wilfordii TaxID=458696 RepID=A0A7J7BZQ5_TRIWF|nr:rho GDP-dissociation inhibitor 1-like isoform X2 [Tripterygium wilfordii]XP_038692371.1 rho GDP-dissociation inhibitor 1-like isoform X2 [Tripterygium wilfordii]KAF5726996.1 rho GDP-dissociation inhibitor 1-like [Tripterygium wilfordii]
MESGKGAEAGPSKGGVFGDDKEEAERTEKLRDHGVDVDVEESDDDDDKVAAAAGFVPGPLLSLKEQIEKDKEDDSLRRWKETLLGCLEGDLNGQMEPEVDFRSISIISDDFGEIITPLPVSDNQSSGVLFTLREGSQYQLKLTFSVLHNIVSGLTYSNSVWKGGLQVDQSKGMLGTFAPQREPYVHLLEEETTPSGALARGIYSAKLKFEDDDKRCHMELRYSFEIKKRGR